LNLVVFRPYSSGYYYYPEVYASSGSGSAYIEWKYSSSSISIGSSYSCYLSYSNCVEIFQAYLNTGTTYSFTLQTPSGGDFDLFLYRVSSGSATGYSGYIRGSATSGQGSYEYITNYAPSYSDYYAVIITWKSGSGTAYLTSSSVNSNSNKPINPAMPIFIVFGILATLGISAGVYKNYIGQQRNPARQPQRPTQITMQTVKAIPPKMEPLKVIQKPPPVLVCDYCQSKNEMSELFCRNCGSEL
jgi:hypothetical protein